MDQDDCLIGQSIEEYGYGRIGNFVTNLHRRAIDNAGSSC
jgi:hypothetical protein